jgi:5-methylcytosine-specific restriction endonuclease McrA
MALLRDHHRCVRCGATAALEVHHRVSVADGGPNALDNLETVCNHCHTEGA